MQQRTRWMIGAVTIVGLQLTACQAPSDSPEPEHPSEVHHVEGSDLSLVTLTERAIERLDLQTDRVREQSVSRAATPQKVVPYSSLIYDPQGQTWVYTSPEPRTFVRERVVVDYIEGNRVVLTEGPPEGTLVASVGAAELYGTEFEVGH